MKYKRIAHEAYAEKWDGTNPDKIQEVLSHLKGKYKVVPFPNAQDGSKRIEIFCPTIDDEDRLSSVVYEGFWVVAIPQFDAFDILDDEDMKDEYELDEE